jgi:preprotein translocase subunit YajC
MQDPAAMMQMLSLVLVFVVLYFLMIRPQAKRQKEREAMLKKVGKGDRVLTTGGFYGTVVSVKSDDVMVLKMADNVRVDMARSAVTAVVGKASDAEAS